MSHLDLKMYNFQDPGPATAKPKTALPVLKPKPSNQSYAYKYVGTTGYSDTKVLNILEDFLQPGTTTSLDSAVQSILDLLPENAPMSTEVRSVGELCLDVAELIPYYHLSQIKLARVVEEMSRSSKLTHPPDETGMHFRFFRFKESLMDAYKGPVEENRAAWPNLHAFFAHVEDCRIGRPSPLFAIRAMRDAFECNLDDEKNPFEGIQDQKVLRQLSIFSGTDRACSNKSGTLVMCQRITGGRGNQGLYTMANDRFLWIDGVFGVAALRLLRKTALLVMNAGVWLKKRPRRWIR